MTVTTNTADRKALAKAIAEAVAEVDSDIILLGLANSHLITEAKKAGLRAASEVFADRAYQADGSLVLADEVLTPDSSRFWPKASYRVGANPPSLDKQFVRDWLDSIHFNHQPPGPVLPDDVIARMREIYVKRHTGLLRPVSFHSAPRMPSRRSRACARSRRPEAQAPEAGG